MRKSWLLFTLTLLTSLTSITLAQTSDLAHAIAKAEGFGTRGTIPQRYHNPGDLKTIRGYKYIGQIGTGKGGHAIFRSDAAGWAALIHQIEKMCGDSGRYSPQMTLVDVAKKYAGNWRLWSKNVAHNLGVPATTTLAECLGLPPSLRFTTDGHELAGIL
jgi:hypothetical protein